VVPEVKRDLEKNWRGFKEKMDAPLFKVDVIINDCQNEETLIDNGATVYASVNKGFLRRNHCEILEIPPRRAEGWVSGNETAITQVAKMKIDVGGVIEHAFAYVVPQQKEAMILGRSWMLRNGVKINEEKEQLEFSWHRAVLLNKNCNGLLTVDVAWDDIPCRINVLPSHIHLLSVHSSLSLSLSFSLKSNIAYFTQH
jgi:predicted aspartyl protease